MPVTFVLQLGARRMPRYFASSQPQKCEGSSKDQRLRTRRPLFSRLQLCLLIWTPGGTIKFGGVYLGSKTDALQMFTNAGLFSALGQPASNVSFSVCMHHD